jgi:hypothetical protein
VFASRASASLGVLGQLGPSIDAGVRGHADRVGDRGHGRRGVAGDQLQVDFLLAHEGDRLGRVGRSVSSSTTSASGVSRGGGRAPGRRAAPRRLAEGDDAPPAAVSSSSLRASPAAGQRPGRARTSGAPST